METAVAPQKAPQRASKRARRRSRWSSVSELEFAGCVSQRMTLAEYDALPEDDRKIEFFDSESGLAWMAEDGPSLTHEQPGVRLAVLAQQIAMVRGAPMAFGGSGQLRVRNPATGFVRVMCPDQLIFLDPSRVSGNGRFLSVGRDPYPDVVLEVDITRDTRRDKAKLYEEWGFPELWVEVPDAEFPRRRSGLRPELRIYLLEEGRFAQSKVSRAFPGWTATEIHRALNEKTISATTTEVLRRVGRMLGDREGTRSEDDPLLGVTLAEGFAKGRTEGFAKGRTEGFVEGRTEGFVEGRAALVRTMLASRNIEISSAGWPAERMKDLAAASDEAVVAAATEATSETDFFSKLR